MTVSELAPLLGVQAPQILLEPLDVHSLAAAEEAVEFADSVGMTLDESQRMTLRGACATRANESWAAFQVADIQPRQNGKGDTIQAREAVGLFLWGERLQIHTAHEFPTANEAFLRFVALVQSNPELEKKVARIRYANGEQGVELKDGARLKYRARTGGSGRGFAEADLIVMDEAYSIKAEQVAALLPTLSVNPNPQIWFASSAGMSTSTQLWHMRKVALRGERGRIFYSEHTAERVMLDERGRAISQGAPDHSNESVALANPAYGYRISVDYIDAERATMTPDVFARERLGVFDPLDGEEGDAAIPAAEWAAAADTASKPLDPVSLSLDVTPDRRFTAAAVAGYRADGLPHIEVVAHEPGTAWVVDWVLARKDSFDSIVVDPAGPAGSLILDLENAGITVSQSSPRDMAQACGALYDAILEGAVRHLDQPILNAAVSLAERRPLADAWAWQRKSKGDISPLVAATLALSAARRPPEQSAPVFAF